ncbi:MAG: amidohydrolase family protein [Phycisphaeraceae bacterium]
MHSTTAGRRPRHDANRLGLDYRAEARAFPYAGPIHDVHTHLTTLPAARAYFEAADAYGIDKVWSMSPLEQVDALRDAFGDRIQFIAVPNYAARDEPGTFTTDWLKRIEAFAARGVKVCKFWAAPRGRDFDADALRLDSAHRFEQMRLARSLGMMFMTHVADPDTWFATRYSEASQYGTKPEHYDALRRALDAFGDVPWLAAHMAGHPEDLEHLQQLLDDYPQLYLDTSATKWMVRELSKHPDAFADFVRRNPGRVLFGSDIVASDENLAPSEELGDAVGFELYASRYWALRTLMETRYDGPSPIVDPDLSMVDPSLPEQSTATLRGAGLDEPTLRMLYHDAASDLLEGWAQHGHPRHRQDFATHRRQ